MPNRQLSTTRRASLGGFERGLSGLVATRKQRFAEALGWGKGRGPACNNPKVEGGAKDKDPVEAQD